MVEVLGCRSVTFTDDQLEEGSFLTGNRKYSRHFIIMRQEAQGYGVEAKEPTGYCKIEVRDGKAKAQTFVQGLKALSEGGVYKACFIGKTSEGMVGIPAGVIRIDGHGRGEAKWEFDPDRIGGLDLAIEGVEAVAVLVKNDRSMGKEIISPLVGYKEKEIAWKHNFEEVGVQQDRDIAHKQEPVTVESAAIEEIIEETVEEIVEDIVLEQKQEPMQMPEDSRMVEPVVEPIVEASMEPHGEMNDYWADREDAERKVQPEQELSKEVIPDAWGNDEGDSQELCGTAKDFYNNLLEDICVSEESMPVFQPEACQQQVKDADTYLYHQAFHSMVDQYKQELHTVDHIKYTPPPVAPKEVQPIISVETPYCSCQDETEDMDIEIQSLFDIQEKDITYMMEHQPVMNPFEKQEEGIKWIRICIRDLAVLPISAWRYMTCPLVIAGNMKYKHLMLGMYQKENIKRYIVGVPDVYNEAQQTPAAQLGFHQFKCCQDKEAQAGEYGYWIMEI